VDGSRRHATPPNQIDIITTIDGVPFETAWKSRVEATDSGIPVTYVVRDDLVANKEAGGRPQALPDVAYLRKARNR
jgi:hypothetical protein